MAHINEGNKKIGDHLLVVFLFLMLCGASTFCYVALAYANIFSIVLGTTFLVIACIIATFYIKGYLLYRKYKRYETYMVDGELEIDEKAKLIVLRSGSKVKSINLEEDTYDYVFDIIAFKDTTCDKWYKIHHDNRNFFVKVNNLIKEK